MKKMLIAALLALPLTMAAQSGHLTHVHTDELSDNVLVPTKVLTVDGKPKKTTSTWAVIEDNEEFTGTKGPIRLIARGSLVSTYAVGNDTVALLNRDFTMKDSVLHDRKDRGLEAIIIDIADFPCSEKTSIDFRRDSTTTNTSPGTFKMLYATDSAHWRPHGSYNIPGIEMLTVDTIDTDPIAKYALAIRTKEGAMCEFFWLSMEERKIPNKTQVYAVPEREGKRFSYGPNNEKLFDGDPILEYIVMKEIIPNTGKTKKQKNPKRTRN